MSATSVTAHPAHPSTDRALKWITSSLRDVVYAGAIYLWSMVAFTVLVTGVSLTLSLIVLIVGVFVWVGFAHVMRWTTSVDRRLAAWRNQQPVPAAYREPAEPGFVPLLKTVTTDSQTWRDMGWLGLTSLLGFTLGLLVLTVVGIVASYVLMPLWYWAVTGTDTLYGITNLGVVDVDSLGEAFAMTGIGLALAPLALLLAQGCAAAHARLAARILGGARKF